MTENDPTAVGRPNRRNVLAGVAVAAVAFVGGAVAFGGADDPEVEVVRDVAEVETTTSTAVIETTTTEVEVVVEDPEPVVVEPAPVAPPTPAPAPAPSPPPVEADPVDPGLPDGVIALPPNPQTPDPEGPPPLCWQSQVGEQESWRVICPPGVSGGSVLEPIP